ncbi:MAG TPA: acyclic terpene utilization AtuA family protein [Bryobacteraceae bacterium]|nr:acyclic terpene utilization AtuA family protein [Bryobacteraceae bacterium]
MIRIANGQGFWGDWLEAPVRLIEQGPLDYLTLDYLAEVTMSILQKQKQENPEFGYARDFPPLIGRIAKQLPARGVKVVANAGGVNPMACARAVKRAAPGLKVAVVLGDDVFPRIRELCEAPPDNVLAANAYLGAFPLAEALATGADVVIGGRYADPVLAMAPMIYRYGWTETDWDKLAGGAVAGHLIECGTQATGGNCQAGWQAIPGLAEIGYPIVEAEPDGSFTLTKHPASGGVVNLATVKEQLVYEIGDPKRFITPDCTADFTTIALRQDGPDRVRVTGVCGGPRPEKLKLSVAYAAGWKAVGTMVYTWPDALAKARAADAIVRQRLAQLGLTFDAIHTEYFGVNACLGPAAPPNPDPPEVQLRIGVRGPKRADIERFTREMIPLVLSGPPGATGYGEGRPKVREVVGYWSALVPREAIQTRIEVLE